MKDNSQQIELNIIYQLARDRERRTIKPPARFAKADIASFSLVAAVEVECYELRIYLEAITCSENEKWIVAI